MKTSILAYFGLARSGPAYTGARHSGLSYTALAVLFAVTVVYQVARAVYLNPQWFSTHRFEEPFVVSATPKGFMVGWASPWARAAGIQSGQILRAINGKAVRGLKDFGQALVNAQPGDIEYMTVQPANQGRLLPKRTLSLAMPKETRPDASAFPLSALFFVVIPIFCVAVGFWVVAVRIRDPLAWLLLALMLSFAAVTYPAPEVWSASLRDFGAVYYAGLVTSWPIWMLLFGIYFPEAFPKGRWRELWKWVQWAVVIPLAFFVVIHVVTAAGSMVDYTSVRSFLSVEWRLAPVDSALMVAGIAGFCICMALKLRLAGSRDARRRLRLLSAGTVVSLAPIGALIVITWLHGWVPGSHFPDWLWLSTFLVAFLFPLTLAYVIVVERAMDVRVVVRQGLRYTFAKSGVNAIQIAFGACLTVVLIFVFKHVRPYSVPFFVAIALAVLAIVETRRAFRKFRLWVDRKFFRDAYDAEQILSELGDQMRSIVDPHRLLDRMCSSIAESLHVPRVAVLLQDHGTFKPAYVLGYQSPPHVSFSDRASALEQMRRASEPLTVYFDDPESWMHSRKITPEEREALQALQSQLLLPLSANEKLLGFVSLGEKRSEEPYSRSDIRLLKSAASQAGLALENAQLSAALAREAAERERLKRDVEIAREVQERLLPQNLAPVAGLDYCGICRPAFGVGGDYYDFLAFPGGKMGIAVADVCGKGISAALMMATLHAWVRGEAARADCDLSRLVSSVSGLLYEASDSNRYATLFYAQYEPSSRRLTYVNAGHNPPVLLRRRGDKWEAGRLSEGGTVVGLFEHVSYCQGSEVLEPGSLLVAFTDGITEAESVDGEEWGEERLIELIRRASRLSADEIARRILDAIDSFTAGAQQHDDMTLVILCATTN